MSLSSLLQPRRLTASIVLAGALAGAAVSAPAIASAVTGTSAATHASAEAPVFTYYRCYVPGYGWMYCTDDAHR